MGIRVFYQRVGPGPELEAITERIADQMATEAHHKDHDFWHSEEFWGQVIGAAIANPQRDRVHIDNTPTLSKGDAKAFETVWQGAKELGILKSYPTAESVIWEHAIRE